MDVPLNTARREEKGKMIGPSNVKEICTFLGAVQFYRRFVPRIALLAALRAATHPTITPVAERDSGLSVPSSGVEMPRFAVAF